MPSCKWFQRLREAGNGTPAQGPQEGYSLRSRRWLSIWMLHSSENTTSAKPTLALVSQASRIFLRVRMRVELNGWGKERKIRLVTLARFSYQAGM